MTPPGRTIRAAGRPSQRGQYILIITGHGMPLALSGIRATTGRVDPHSYPRASLQDGLVRATFTEDHSTPTTKTVRLTLPQRGSAHGNTTVGLGSFRQRSLTPPNTNDTNRRSSAMNDTIDTPHGTALHQQNGSLSIPVLRCKHCDFPFGMASKTMFKNGTGVIMRCPRCDKETGFSNPYRK